MATKRNPAVANNGVDFQHGTAAPLQSSPILTLPSQHQPGMGSSTSMPVIPGDTGSAFSLPQFLYHGPLHLDAITPIAGTMGATVTVRGSGFVDSGSLSCRFGNAALSPGIFVSYHTVLCRAPFPPPGTGNKGVALAVSTNGVDFAESREQFRFEAPPEPHRLEPSAGPLSAGTKVTALKMSSRSILCSLILRLFFNNLCR